MPQYGYSGPRFNMDSTLSIPTVCGTPTLKSVLTKKAAIAFDSCNNRFYQYNPKTLTWSQISGGGGGSTDTTSLSNRIDQKLNIVDTANKWVNSVSKLNDSTIRVIKGSTTTDISITSATSATRLTTSVYNNSGATITKGSVVYINGRHSSNLPTIAKAQANTETNSYSTFAMVQDDIANSNSGTVIQAGNIGNLNLPTSSYTDGQLVYLSPTTAGGITTTKPLAPNHIVKIGTITRAHPTLGTIELKIENGWQLDELSDVKIAAVPADSVILQFSRVDSLWHDVSVKTAIGKKVDTIYKNTNRDSIVFTINGKRYAVRDSIGAGGGGSPAGPINAIQYNNAGVFGGNANLQFNGASGNVGIGNPSYYYGKLNIGNDFTSLDPTNAAIYMQNNELYGNNTIYSEILSQPKGLWRTDFDGNNYWVAFDGNHYFYTGGDIGEGSSKLTIFNNGNVLIGDSLFWNYATNRLSINAGTSPNSALTVKGSDGINFYGLPQRNDYNDVLCYNSSNGQLGYKAVSGTGVDTIYRTPGKDSIIFTIGGIRRAIKDSSGGKGTVTRAVDSIYRTPGKDSIIFTINGTRYAIKDSSLAVAGASGSDREIQFNNTGALDGAPGLTYDLDYNLVEIKKVGSAGTQLRLDVHDGEQGDMPRNFEVANFSKDGDCKLGIYTSGNYAAGGTSIIFGNTNALNSAGYYPSFEFQNGNDSANPENSFMRYNYIQRNNFGQIANATVNLMNLYADGKIEIAGSDFYSGINVNPRLIIGGDNTGATLEVSGDANITGKITGNAARVKRINYLSSDDIGDSYNVQSTDHVIVYATYDDCTVILPSSVDDGRELIIKHAGDYANYTLTIDGNGNDIYDARSSTATILNDTQPNTITIIYYDGSWFLLSGQYQ